MGLAIISGDTVRDWAVFLGPITTLLAGFIGLWLGYRYAAQKETRQAKQDTYRRVLRYISTLSNRARDAQRSDDPKHVLEAIMREMNELKADVELDSSDEVQRHFRAFLEKLDSFEFLDALDEADEENEKRMREEADFEAARAAGAKPPRSKSLPLLYEYEKAIREVTSGEREALVRAMKKDLRP